MTVVPTAGTREREVQGKAKISGHFTCENSPDPDKPRRHFRVEETEVQRGPLPHSSVRQLASVGDKVTQAGSQVSNTGEMALP